jgi:ATP-dependent protease ClpP protease subunit
MKKELYLYSGIYDFTIQDLLEKMEACGEEDMNIRICCGGGNIFAAWGFYAKMKEVPGDVTLKVDGMAASAAAYALLFCDKSEAIETSTIMLHRASGPVSNQADQDFLDQKNADLRKRLTAKIDGKKLKELKGVTIKDLFEATERIDVYLTAKEAEQIGLIDKTVPVNATEIRAINERMYNIAAEHTPPTPPIQQPPNSKPMDLIKFKAEHPALYKELFAKGVEKGTAKERDRVGSILAFLDADPKAVKALITEGKELTATQTSEFVIKMNSPEVLAKIAAVATPPVKTGEPDTKEVSAEEKRLATIEAATRKELGLDKEVKK